MMLEGRWKALMVVVAVWTSGAAGEMARLMSRQGLGLTSSTMEWLDVEAGQPLPAGALQVDENVGAWCRFTDHGTLAGVVRDGVCHAPFMDTVATSEKYEALVSINDSSRLLETNWSRAAAPKPGGVQVAKKRLLALVRTAEGAVLPGFVDTKVRWAYMLNGNKVERHEDAFTLTEDEPVRYEMNNVVWDEGRSTLTSEDNLLQELTLENPDAEAKQVSKQVEYTTTKVLYWGNVRGTVKGVSASVTDPGGMVWDDTWGVQSDYERVEQQTVSLEVPAGASVAVKLVGVMHKFESPYTAQLTAVYGDGTRRTRSVVSLHQHTYLAELRADFEHPVSLADGQKLEGDFPTSEVLIASTTTTSTTTTTPAPPSTAPDAAEQAGSLATPETNPAAPLPSLTPPLLACCLALLGRHARP